MGSRQRPELMSKTVVKSTLVVIASVVIAFLARFAADRGLFPEDYVLPIYAVIVFAGGYIIIRIITGVLDYVAQPTLGTTRTRGLRNTLQLIGGIILVILAFAIFGYNLTGALIGAGFLGIVLGLGAQQVLGNIFAGLSLLVAKPFEIGDRVTLATSAYGLTGSSYSHESQVSGFTGVVVDVGIFFTRLVLDGGSPAVLPNSIVIGAMVVNNSKTTARSVRVRIDLDKAIDFDRFKLKLLEALRGHDSLDSSDVMVEICDVGTSSYQALIEAKAKVELEESGRTIVYREAMKARDELAASETHGSGK